MELGELPSWAQQIGAIILTVGTAVTLQWSARRKESKEPQQEAGERTAQVMAAYFFDRKIVEAMTAELGRVSKGLDELNDHMREASQWRHDERIARDAAARALSERGIRP